MNNISYWLYNEKYDADVKSEKYISNIINYHMERLNLHKQSPKNTIEVEIVKNPDNNIYPIFKNNETIMYPILSCMVFLSDSELPFVMTEIDVDNYKYKEFKNQDKINILFPKKNTHVVFNGNTCNGFVIPQDTNININTNTENPINAILINVWHSETENEKPMITRAIENTTSEFIPLNKEIIWTNDFLTYNMFNNLLYMKKYTHQNMKPIFELYNRELPQNWYVIMKTEINVRNMDNNSNLNNRFLQRFNIKSFLSPNTCDWLIKTATKDDTYLSSSYYQSYICMMENKEMNSFTRTMLESVCDEINKSYNISETNNAKIEITDVLLVKYDKNNTINNGLKMLSYTNHHITAEIMLSLLDENNNNNEGQLIFNDGLNVTLNEGDMVIYSNLISHSVNKISSEDTILYKIIIHMKINKD